MTGPRIVGFVCHWAANDLRDRIKTLSKDGTKIFEMNCLANITASTLTTIVSKGVDVIFMLQCNDDSCKFYDGIAKVENLLNGLEALLEDMGVEPERIVSIKATEDDPDPLGRIVEQSKRKAKEVGPSPLK